MHELVRSFHAACRWMCACLAPPSGSTRTEGASPWLLAASNYPPIFGENIRPRTKLISALEPAHTCMKMPFWLQVDAWVLKPPQLLHKGSPMSGAAGSANEPPKIYVVEHPLPTQT